MSQIMNRRSGRRVFLRQAAKALGAGVGLVVFSGAAASATPERQGSGPEGGMTPQNQIPVRCCADARTCGSGCGSGQVKFYCTSICGSYCTSSCQPASPNCYTYYIPAC